MNLKQARALIKGLPPGLIRHIERARKLGRELAEIHGVSPHRAALSILLHDIARNVEKTELLKLAESFGLDITENDLQIPLLLHGPVGACLLKRDRGLKDADILEAVSSHTTGKPGMGKLSKVAFLADKLEVEKIKESPGLEKVRELAYKDLDKAVLAYLLWQKKNLENQGLHLHPVAEKTLLSLTVIPAEAGIRLSRARP